jgi:hypothetical protein
VSEPDVGEAMRRADAHPRVSGWGIWFLARDHYQGMVTLRPDARPLFAEGSTAARALLAALAKIDDEDEPR